MPESKNKSSDSKQISLKKDAKQSIDRDLTPSPVLKSVSRRVNICHYESKIYHRKCCSGFSLWCWFWNLYWATEAEWGWEHSGLSQCTGAGAGEWTEQGREDLASHSRPTLRYSNIHTKMSSNYFQFALRDSIKKKVRHLSTLNNLIFLEFHQIY